jgi:hypothetical protein
MRLAAIFFPSLALVAGVSIACDRTPEGPSSGPTPPVASTAPAMSGAPQGSGAPLPSPLPSLSPPLAPPPEFVQAVVTAEKAIASGDFALADRQLDAAAATTADDAHLLFVVALYRATRFTYAGDFEHAGVALGSVIPELAKHPELPDEFSAHNQMMIIRVAQGDPAAALAEDDQATLAAGRGTWAPQDREILAYLKDRWHRAYLSRMLAESRAGAARQTLLRGAEAALSDYRTRARQLGTNEDSVAVLEAYFAALDGKREAALRAAKKVDPAKDDDLEDLYLVVVGLEAGGDHAAAERVRQRMRQRGEVHLSRPIMLRWLEHDTKVPRDKTFTPWHPS